MSDRPDLDEFASKLQAGGWNITGGKYAPDNPTPLADSAELEQQLATELRHTLKLVPQSQRELFVYELAQYMSKHHQALLQKIEEAGPKRLELATQPRVLGGNPMTKQEIEATLEFIKGHNEAVGESTNILNQAGEGKL